ncbi:hypothetical protein D3C79_586820 [compost metagenome]
MQGKKGDPRVAFLVCAGFSALSPFLPGLAAIETALRRGKCRVQRGEGGDGRIDAGELLFADRLPGQHQADRLLVQQHLTRGEPLCP